MNDVEIDKVLPGADNGQRVEQVIRCGIRYSKGHGHKYTYITYEPDDEPEVIMAAFMDIDSYSWQDPGDRPLPPEAPLMEGDQPKWVGQEYEFQKRNYLHSLDVWGREYEIFKKVQRAMAGDTDAARELLEGLPRGLFEFIDVKEFNNG